MLLGLLRYVESVWWKYCVVGFYASLPNSVQCWEYLHRRNWQMLRIEASYCPPPLEKLGGAGVLSVGETVGLLALKVSFMPFSVHI